jgi:hypothetical protein
VDVRDVGLRGHSDDEIAGYAQTHGLILSPPISVSAMSFDSLSAPILELSWRVFPTKFDPTN